MGDALKRLIQLLNTTGETCVVLDSGGKPQFVILPFKEFESLVKNRQEVVRMSEKEFLDKINRDIASWKSGQEDEKYGELESDLPEKGNKKEERNTGSGKDDVVYFEPID